jgi:glucose/arabinose dehydrogenase
MGRLVGGIPGRALWLSVLLHIASASLAPAGRWDDGPRAGQDREGQAVRGFDAARFFGDVQDRTRRATPAEGLKLADGFRVELVYTVRADQGSWVCLTGDPQGRLIASAQSGKLYRVTLPREGRPASETRVEPIDLDIGGAQGLLFAFDSLYVVAKSDTSGLYRVRDNDGDDRFDRVEPLRRFEGQGEHGPHGVALGPAGKDLYVVGGNGSYLEKPPDRSAVPPGWREDRLLRRIGESDGAFGTDRPGGWVCRTDPEGKPFELVAMGFRNPYDLAFNTQGELFTFDSDMECDAGTPWYRPTRVNHVIDGADFGWRAGTSKWPEDYPDSFGSVVDVGFSSPTGVTFGTGARFPPRYRQALFLADWSYGNIYAVHMEPRGGSYTGVAEPFVSGAPLPVTDLFVRLQDGALYFTIGGRGTTSALYRVTHHGRLPDGRPEAGVNHGLELRRLRHRLESGGPIDLAWSNLGHPDRAVRHAARLAVERQPVEAWRGRALAEGDPRARIAAAVALARREGPSAGAGIVEALGRLDWGALADEDRLDLLRAYELTACRSLPHDRATRERIVRQLDPWFPTHNGRLDRELAEVLTAIEAPGVIPRTLRLLEEARSQEQQIHFAMCLRDLPRGWTLGDHKRYFSWLARTGGQRGGITFGEYVGQIRRDAVRHLGAEAKRELADLLRGPPAEDPYAGLKARTFVRKWTVDELLPAAERSEGAGDRERGRGVFAAALCYRCHRFEGWGAWSGRT